MNERVKKLWIEALTSGEYEQGTGRLRDGDKFCCLGVLEDLRKQESGAKWRTSDCRASMPSCSTYRWAKLPTITSSLTTLAELNDTGTGFPEIAKLIEANL